MGQGGTAMERDDDVEGDEEDAASVTGEAHKESDPKDEDRDEGDDEHEIMAGSEHDWAVAKAARSRNNTPTDITASDASRPQTPLSIEDEREAPREDSDPPKPTGEADPDSEASQGALTGEPDDEERGSAQGDTVPAEPTLLVVLTDIVAPEPEEGADAPLACAFEDSPTGEPGETYLPGVGHIRDTPKEPEVGALVSKIERELTPTTEKYKGIVYILKHKNYKNLYKVGHTKQSMSRRQSGSAACFRERSEEVYQSPVRFRGAARAEALAQKAMRARKLDLTRCEVCNGSKSHREWFVGSLEEVKGCLESWAEFVRGSYDLRGRFAEDLHDVLKRLSPSAVRSVQLLAESAIEKPEPTSPMSGIKADKGKTRDTRSLILELGDMLDESDNEDPAGDSKPSSLTERFRRASTKTAPSKRGPGNSPRRARTRGAIGKLAAVPIGVVAAQSEAKSTDQGRRRSGRVLKRLAVATEPLQTLRA